MLSLHCSLADELARGNNSCFRLLFDDACSQVFVNSANIKNSCISEIQLEINFVQAYTSCSS